MRFLNFISSIATATVVTNLTIVIALPQQRLITDHTNLEKEVTNVKHRVYALPEVRVKLRNGTDLAVEPNSPIVLSSELKWIELICTADYPVRWEYLIRNKTKPVLDVVYRRLFRNVSDFSNPKRNRFMALITLRGLLEFQTGKYLCRHYNDKLSSSNNSYAISSYYDIFIPGNKTFNTISSVQFMNKTARSVTVHCPVTNPELHVHLFKLNEKHYNKTKEVLWKPIYANYDPTEGFKLSAGLGRELLGTFNCSASNGFSVIQVVADLSDQDLYYASFPSISPNSSCWENNQFIQYVRSKRLECYCQDSFGLFMNDNYEFENRQASCSMQKVFNQLQTCADWRLNEFFNNEEESQEKCFREKPHFDGSGSRPSLKVRGEVFSNKTDQTRPPFTKLSITYNGFVDWAGDFMLAICRKEVCLQQRENIGVSNSNTPTALEFLEIEPNTKYFPLAYQQAVWKDLYVNGTDVKLVYIFQAHSLSYAWFPYATTKIQWGNEKTETLPSSPPGYNQNINNNITSSSSSASKVILVTSSNYYYMITLCFVHFAFTLICHVLDSIRADL